MVWRGSDIYASVVKAFGYCDDSALMSSVLMRMVWVLALVVMLG
jgi:hypothetical protein